MRGQKTPVFTFVQRLGYINFKVNVHCKDDADVTHEDKPFALSRSAL